MKIMTSIEWLVEQLKERGYAGEFPPHLLFEQAKEMHKREIIEAYDAGLFDGSMDDVNDRMHKQYYQETFKKD